jgi:hypothetical protein
VKEKLFPSFAIHTICSGYWTRRLPRVVLFRQKFFFPKAGAV